MELTNEFRVGVSVPEAWKVLTDVERIAPMMPGAQLQEVEGDEYRGVVKVKVGPITAEYKGKATFEERDEAAGRVVLRATGRDSRGQGNASALITATMTPDGDGTKVSVVTDLTVSGKVAQFGRGVLGEVSAKLLGQFVDALEADLERRAPTRRRPADGRGGRAGGGTQATARAGDRQRGGAPPARSAGSGARGRAGRPGRGGRRLDRQAPGAGGGGRPGDPDRAGPPAGPASGSHRLAVTDAGDRERVAQLLGRPPRGPFTVVVRDAAGDPLVIRNAPILDDGTPMPTRYWLVGQAARAAVDRLEVRGRGPGRRSRRRSRGAGGGPRRLRGGARRRHPARLDRAPAVGRGRRDQEGREVPARPLRLAPGRRRRPRGPLGGRPVCSRWRPSTAAPTRPGCWWPGRAGRRSSG